MSLRWFLLYATFLISTVQATAQVTELTSDPVSVNFQNINYPLVIRITKPEGLDREEKTRGFKRLKEKEILFEGYISDDNGLSQVFLNKKAIEFDESGFFSEVLKLSPGDNELRVVALDKRGNTETQSFYFFVEADNESTISVGTYYALLIGVNEYSDERIEDLDKPIDDATAIKEVLIEGYTFREENITFLKNASRKRIIDALDSLSRIIGGNDNLLIFYAGHGYWDEETEIGYWIPSDAKHSSTAEWFRNSTLTDQIRSIRSRHTLLIADACFSGAIFKTRSAFKDADKATNLKYKLPSRKAMTSGALTMVPDRSAFIKYLIKRLSENTEKYLASDNLFYSFREAVINNSDEGIKPLYGTIQKVGDEGGDFIFVKKTQTTDEGDG